MTQDPPPDGGDDHLLPWLATGRLEPGDTGRIRAALLGDPDLRRGLAAAQQEQAATVRLNEALGAPSPAAQAALFARIDASARRRPTGLVERLGAWLSTFAPRTIAFGAVGALALALVQAGVLSALLLPPRAGTSFSTASAPPVSGGPIVLVGFAPDASAAAITALLHAVQASIVGGPHPGGLYEVRIADAPLSSAERNAVVARLRQATTVVRLVTNPARSDESKD